MLKNSVLAFAIIVLFLMGVYVAFILDTHLSKEEEMVFAIEWNDKELLKKLFLKGTSPNFETSRNTPSLFTRKLIEFLPNKFKNELKFEYINKGIVPLCYVVQSNNIDLTKILVQAGANPNYLDSRGNSPLSYSFHVCGNRESYQVNRYLKSHGAIKVSCGIVFSQLKEEEAVEDSVDSNLEVSEGSYEVKFYTPPEQPISKPNSLEK